MPRVGRLNRNAFGLHRQDQVDDVLQANVATQKVMDLTANYAGDIPVVTWTGLFSNPDSALWRYSSAREGFPSQAIRGEAYAEKGKIDLAKGELAKIEALCGTQCEQYRDLAAAIAGTPSGT